MDVIAKKHFSPAASFRLFTLHRHPKCVMCKYTHHTIYQMWNNHENQELEHFEAFNEQTNIQASLSKPMRSLMCHLSLLNAQSGIFVGICRYTLEATSEGHTNLKDRRNKKKRVNKNLSMEFYRFLGVIRWVLETKKKRLLVLFILYGIRRNLQQQQFHCHANEN